MDMVISKQDLMVAKRTLILIEQVKTTINHSISNINGKRHKRPIVITIIIMKTKENPTSIKEGSSTAREPLKVAVI